MFGPAFDVDAFLAELRSALDDPAAVRAAYRAQLVTLGRHVRVERAGDHLTGEAQDVTDTGALVVRDDTGTVHEIVVGDVVHLRYQ